MGKHLLLKQLRAWGIVKKPAKYCKSYGNSVYLQSDWIKIKTGMFEVFHNHYYSVKEAAKVLGLAPQKVRNLAKAGKISYTKGISRGMRFSDFDLRQYVASAKQYATK